MEQSAAGSRRRENGTNSAWCLPFKVFRLQVLQACSFANEGGGGGPPPGAAEDGGVAVAGNAPLRLEALLGPRPRPPRRPMECPLPIFYGCGCE